MSQALALGETAERAAAAAGGAGGGGGGQAMLADLRDLRSAAAPTMKEWLEKDGYNAFWFYSALRTAGHVLSYMIDRFKEARGDPSRERAALDGWRRFRRSPTLSRRPESGPTSAIAMATR